ncbi:MAG: L-aspartate oxidase [Porticoccaceae bacterium]|nr:MAG: L-aspartate oxidase [Porticoccaceae bacterium]
MSEYHRYDVLVVGSGAAGASCAIRLAERGYRVAVLSKSSLHSGSTWLAQGGVAAVFDSEDSIEAHIRDTLAAGAGLCHEEVVRFTVEHGPAVIQWLVERGMNFTRDPATGEFHLTREGGHSHRRVLHSADATGKAVAETLTDRLLAQPTVRAFEDHVIVDLITQADCNSRKIRCTGAYVLNRRADRVDVFLAKAVVLATGGASRVYLYSSNPVEASGDGIAVAWRQGCRVANMEFNQFHPTCLYHPQARSLLLTEALRGEGAVLRLPSGERFMDRFHPAAELAPRDIVARAIDHEMKRLGVDFVYLDITHKPAEFVKSHFPNVYEQCLKYGFDITREPVPVVPAAHYTCGGILTDLHGRTDLKNLYAIGETAWTGLHGANRMASNSLLECLVFAWSAAEHIDRVIDTIPEPAEPAPWDESRVTYSDEDVVISHNWDELRRFMWDYVGIVRTRKRLERAEHRIRLLQREIQEYYSNYKVSRDLLELRNLALVAELIIRSAMERKESRGLHYTLDYPDTSPIARDTILVPMNFAGQEVIVRCDPPSGHL